MSEDKPLSHNLSEYHKAIESEFSLSPVGDGPAEARANLVALLPEATKALEAILKSADSDSVCLSAIKLVFEHTLGKPGTGGTEDELTKLIQSLSTKKSSKPTK